MRILSTMAGRGILGGLALATLFGVLNGIAVFGPALKDEKKQKLAADNGQLEVPDTHRPNKIEDNHPPNLDNTTQKKSNESKTNLES